MMGMPIVWRNKMSVGNSTIDHDHKTLIDIINEFETNIRTHDSYIMRTIFQRLFHYASGHFDKEIAIQRQISYPETARHQELHAALLERLRVIQDEFVADSDSPVVRAKTAALLRDWLIDHILREDMKLKPYIAGSQRDSGRRP